MLLLAAMGYDDGAFLVPREVRGNNQRRLRGVPGVPLHVRVLKSFGMLNEDYFSWGDFFYDDNPGVPGVDAIANAPIAPTASIAVA